MLLQKTVGNIVSVILNHRLWPRWRLPQQNLVDIGAYERTTIPSVALLWNCERGGFNQIPVGQFLLVQLAVFVFQVFVGMVQVVSSPVAIGIKTPEGLCRKICNNKGPVIFTNVHWEE